jgi:hypothetical protein
MLFYYHKARCHQVSEVKSWRVKIDLTANTNHHPFYLSDFPTFGLSGLFFFNINTIFISVAKVLNSNYVRFSFN